MSIAEQAAQIIAEPSEIYHARSEQSRGMIADFVESPRLYEGRHITGIVPPKEPTAAMRKGSIAHAALLEPDKFAEQYVVMPAFENDVDNVTKSGDRSKSTATTYYQNKKAAFEKSHAGKIIVDQKDFAMIQGMSAAVARECKSWLDHTGIVERTILWTHPGTGLRCRCRVDWARYTTRPSIIGFDLKGTADPTPHAFRSRVEEGLWLQAAHYSEGLAIATGLDVEAFYFVAVEFDPPHRCCVYQIDPRSMREAREAREQYMFELALCLGSDNWADPQEGKIVSLSVRDFAFKRGE